MRILGEMLRPAVWLAGLLANEGSLATISWSSSKSWMVKVVNKDKVDLVGTLDKESAAELVLPNLYCMEKLYGISFNNHF